MPLGRHEADMTHHSPVHLHDHHHDIRVPKPLLLGMGIMLACITVFAMIASFTGLGAHEANTYTQAETLALRIVDEADGGVGVYAAVTGDLIHIYEPGTGAFVRTALRALALDRQRAGIGPEPAFHLTRTMEGALLLEDPSTNKTITLDAFTAEHAASFDTLFTAKGAANES